MQKIVVLLKLKLFLSLYFLITFYLNFKFFSILCKVQLPSHIQKQIFPTGVQKYENAFFVP